MIINILSRIMNAFLSIYANPDINIMHYICFAYTICILFAFISFKIKQINMLFKETAICSSLTRIVNHEAYQKIIAMGNNAILPIIKDLQIQPKLWGPALKAITGITPDIEEKDFGKIKAVSQWWINWAKENKYIETE